MKALGIILIIIGIAMFIFSGIRYTTEEKIIDAGPLEISTEKEETLNWPNYAGGISILAGLGILIFAGKK